MTARGVAAVARATMLTFVRDRGALFVSLVLPPIIFVIFAAVFSGADSGAARLRVAVADVAGAATTGRLAAALQSEPTLRVTLRQGPASSGEIHELVRAGTVDAGVVLRADLETSAKLGGPPPIVIVSSAAKAVAATMVAGQVQRALSERLPDVAIGQALAEVERTGGVTAEQREWLEDRFLAGFADTAERGGKAKSLSALFARESATGKAEPAGAVTYYAGAVATLFLMLAAAQGAMTLVDERRSGVYERIWATGGGGVVAVLLGKFVFLTGLGTLQACLVYLTAQIVFGVDVLDRFAPWLATTTIVSAMAAALALALVAGCRSRAQAQTLSTFALLILGAVGGCMAPRYLMPPWLQDLGWLTPNAWAIEAFSAALTEGSTASALIGAWSILAAFGVAGALVAAALAQRSRLSART